MTAIVSFCGLLVSSTAHSSGPDLTLDGTIRSYALSGVVEGEAGYGQVLWGNPTTPFYGYVRPRLYGSSAATYNSLDTALEFFPLAFLGVRAGGEAIQNDHRYTPYDCVVYHCVGRFYRAYVESELSLGLGPVFGQFRWRRERWSQPDAQAGDFIDPTSGLAMRSRGDSQTVYYAVAGYNLNPTWAVLAALRYAESDPHDFSRLPFGMLRWRQAGVSVSLGAGTFESTLKKRGMTAVGFLKWDIWPTVGLH